jgi:hypothetical protein
MRESRYAVVFENDMMHPIIIVTKNMIEFIQQLQDVMMKYGKIELMYRIY